MVPLAEAIVPKPPALPQVLPWNTLTGYLWPREHHRLDTPTRTTRALDDLIRLCGREGRCLLYHVPVNPAADHGFEPGLTEEFVAYVRERATGAGVPFEDLRAIGDPAWFRKTLSGRVDAIHMTMDGLGTFAAKLAPIVAAHLRAP
jgi:hypothetical protein